MTRSRQSGPPGERLARCAVLLVVATGLTVLTPGPSSAYTTYGKGRPGKVTIYQTVGTHTRFCHSEVVTGGITWSNCGLQPTVHLPGPKIRRSPRTRKAQSVRVTYRVQRWDVGAWRPQTSEVRTYRIRKRQRAIKVPDQTLVPTAALHLRTVVTVVWRNPRNGRRLGKLTALMNQAGDYTCATRFPCQVGDGWVWLHHPGLPAH